MQDFENILITGASSGLGEALAMHYARPGRFLALTGRNEARLAAVANACRKSGATVETRVMDVSDGAAMQAWFTELEDVHPPDLVIANAGVSGGTGGGGEPIEGARRILQTNVDGVVNTVYPAIENMRARPLPEPSGLRGQIAIMSSLAGFRGLPGAPAYSASKAAVKSWGEALRGEFHRDRIGVSVICPGFVRSPMTDSNDYQMPLLMDADRAARIMARGLSRNRARIAFPWRLYFLVWLVGAMPPGLVDPLLRRGPKKT